MATRTISNAGGNWNATGSWVEGAVPTAADDVVATATSGNLTLNVAANCRSINLTNYVGVLTHNAGISLNIGTTTAGPGNVAMLWPSSGWTYTKGNATTSTVAFLSTSATQQSINTGGKVLGAVAFNGSGGSWILAAALSVDTGAQLTSIAGSFSTGNFSVSAGSFDLIGNPTRTLTLGSSAITIQTGMNWSAATSGTTFTANTAVVTFTTASSSNFLGVNGLDYNGLSFACSAVGVCGIGVFGLGGGAITVGSVTRTGTNDNTVLQFNCDVVVTGILTVLGNSDVQRVLVASNTGAVVRVITAASVLFQYADFWSVQGAGAASWNLAAITGGSGNCGANVGITFTTAVPQSKTSTSSFTWSTLAGWTSRIPLPQDDVTITGAYTGGSTITKGLRRSGRTLDFSGCTGNPALTVTSTSLVSGSITLAAGMTVTAVSDVTFTGMSAAVLTTAGVSWNGVLLVNKGTGGKLTLGGNLTNVQATGQTLVVTSGEFDANDFNVTTSSVSFGSNATVIARLGNGTWTCNGAGVNDGFVFGPLGTMFSEGSTITITGTGANGKRMGLGGNPLYNIVVIASDNVTVGGSARYNRLTLNTAAMTNGTKFLASSTQTMQVLTGNGSAGNLVKIVSATPATFYTFTSPSINVSVNFFSIQDSHAVGVASWFAGTGSTNVSGNTGWSFTNGPSDIRVVGQFAGGVVSSAQVFTPGVVQLGTPDIQIIGTATVASTAVVITAGTVQAGIPITGSAVVASTATGYTGGVVGAGISITGTTTVPSTAQVNAGGSADVIAAIFTTPITSQIAVMNLGAIDLGQVLGSTPIPIVGQFTLVPVSTAQVFTGGVIGNGIPITGAVAVPSTKTVYAGGVVGNGLNLVGGSVVSSGKVAYTGGTIQLQSGIPILPGITVPSTKQVFTGGALAGLPIIGPVTVPSTKSVFTGGLVSGIPSSLSNLTTDQWSGFGMKEMRTMELGIADGELMEERVKAKRLLDSILEELGEGWGDKAGRSGTDGAIRGLAGLADGRGLDAQTSRIPPSLTLSRRNFLERGKLITPADGGLADHTVVSFSVPVGYFGVLMGFYCNYMGTGFVQGSGDILFRLKIGNAWARNMGNLAYTLGTLSNPFSMPLLTVLESGDVVEFLVNVPNTSGMIQVGTAYVLAGLQGWFYPQATYPSIRKV
jgi:hypothetical protein